MSKEEMDLSMNVNGQSKVPPGFRFHPTEEELLHYYLRKKVAYEKIDLDVIREVDLNKLEPWDIQDKCNIGSTPQNDWYFFSHKDKKYPTGTRTNRATAAGFWKATGRDKVVHGGLRRIGMRKTLVFYKGRAPHGQKSDYIMHEYRLNDNIINPTQDSTASNMCDCAHEEGWVVCRVFKKKNYHKSLESPHSSMDNRARLQSLNKDGVFEQLLEYMDRRSCKEEIENFTTTNNANAMQQFVNPMFVHLPRLASATQLTTTSPPESSATFDQGSSLKTFDSMSDLLAEMDHPRSIHTKMVDDHECISDWADLDKFVASQLNGQMEESKHNLYTCYGSESNDKLGYSGEYDEQDLSARRNEAACISELDIWSLSRPSSLDPLCHLSI